MSFLKIDVHTHFLSPVYREALKKAGHFPGPDGLPWTAQWSAEEHLAFMDRNNISKAILSCSSPGTHLIPGDDHFGREVTREVNEYAADLKHKHPTRFGFFASLPLPDIAGTLLEIDYALDHLDADGFVVLSNFHGMYLGDPKLAPIYAKLQARHATVFVHPTTPCIAHAGHQSDPTPKRMLECAPLADAYMLPIMEYFFDSTRTFVDLILTGIAAAHPDVTFVVPHCGSALPSVLDRVIMFSTWKVAGSATLTREMRAITAPAVKDLFARQFYFDLAGEWMPSQINYLLRWVRSDRLVYGSDVPWTPYNGAEKSVQTMEVELPKLFEDQEIRDICEGNAIRLLTRNLS
ncbi:aminocarboxymuconate-semialdehyde decarboxylase [Mycena polygramma]|nr:aminocarboxymuconate-semialdehyde decarboxylase [Mycena polygramma]